MKLIISLLFLSTVLLGCRPEQLPTEFNNLIKVPVGEDVDLITDEDTELEVNYTVEKSEESINLEIAISKQPVHGQLKDCENLSANNVKCTYVPKKDFNGIDSIEVIANDGELVAEESAKINILVQPVNDAPMALDHSFAAKSRTEVQFELPEGIDKDSLSTELSYQIEEHPQNGETVQCNGRICTYMSDSLFSGIDTIEYSVIDQDGLKSERGVVTVNVSPDLYKGTETFTNNVSTVEGVDIVWVIDNSGSMSGEQATLRANFQSFIDNFLNDSTDAEGNPIKEAKFPFNMAVTTTDVYKKEGNPFSVDANGNQYDLSSMKAEADFVSFKADFEAAVSVGINGSGSERALPSISKAYNLLPTWYGANDKLMVYIILTDEQEQGGGIDVATNLAAIQALKNNPAKTKIFPIIRLNNDNGNRYDQIATATGTKVSDIDAPFNDVMDAISLKVSQAVTGYNLKTDVNIVRGTVKVKVNGVETDQFTYDYDANILNLNDPQQAYGSIEVTYDWGKL